MFIVTHAGLNIMKSRVSRSNFETLKKPDLSKVRLNKRNVVMILAKRLI